MNAVSREELFAKIKALPPERVAEVDDFVDFLLARNRVQALDAFLEVGRQVAQAGGAPLALEDVDAEIQTMRREARRQNAAGS